MSFYRDTRLEICESYIKLWGAPFRTIFNAQLGFDSDPGHIYEVKLSPLDRLTITGTNRLFKNFWNWDLMRPFKTYGFEVHLSEKIGPLEKICFTADDHESAKKVIQDNFGVHFTSLD